MVEVAPPAQRMPKSASTHSMRVAGQDGADVLALQAEGAQPAGDGAHPGLGLAPRSASASRPLGVGKAEVVGGSTDAVEEQLAHGAGLGPGLGHG